MWVVTMAHSSWAVRSLVDAHAKSTAIDRSVRFYFLQFFPFTFSTILNGNPWGCIISAFFYLRSSAVRLQLSYSACELAACLCASVSFTIWHWSISTYVCPRLPDSNRKSISCNQKQFCGFVILTWAEATIFTSNTPLRNCSWLFAYYLGNFGRKNFTLFCFFSANLSLA